MTLGFKNLLIFALLAHVCWIFIPSSYSQDGRRPIPSMVEQKEALDILEDTFAKELKSRDRKVRLSLAETFRKKAAAPDVDDVSRYVLLHQASLLSADSVDVASVISDINEIGKLFDIQTDEVVLEGLKKTGKAAKKAAEFIPITESFIGVVDRSVEKDDFDLATLALKEASTAARKSRDRNLKKQVADLKTDVSEKAKRYKSYAAGREVLKTNAEDPAANLKVAYYLCFIKQNWEEGIAHLASSSDEGLSTIALEELNKPEAVADRVKLADGYYDLAEKKKRDKVMAAGLLGKAQQYYDLALPEIKGLQKMKIEKRLEELAAFALKLGGVSKRLITKGLILQGHFDSMGEPFKGADAKPHPFNVGGNVELASGKTKNGFKSERKGHLVTSKPVPLGVKQSVTISIWFKPTQGGILMTELGTPRPNNAYHLAIFEVGDKGRCVTRLWQLRHIELGQAKMGQWNHAVLRYDKETKQFDGFLNGKHVLGEKKERQGAGNSHYGFGCGDGTKVISDRPFIGVIDDVLVYNRKLTDKEISQL